MKKGKVIDKDNKPEPNPFYGDNYERGLDPFHKDAAPDEFKDSRAFSGGKRKEGWFLLDNWGNQIEFIPDGKVMHGL